MLKMTLFAATAVAATLFAVAAMLPLVRDVRGGDAASPLVATAQTLAKAPAQDIRQENGGVRLGQSERRQSTRLDDRRDVKHDKDDD